MERPTGCGCLNTRQLRTAGDGGHGTRDCCPFNGGRYGGSVVTTTEHSPAGTSLTPLRRARERFLSGRPLPEDVPEEVVASWGGGRFFGVPHDLQKGTAGPLPPTGAALLGTARPVLERIAPALGNGRCVLLLTDERPGCCGARQRTGPDSGRPFGADVGPTARPSRCAAVAGQRYTVRALPRPLAGRVGRQRSGDGAGDGAGARHGDRRVPLWSGAGPSGSGARRGRSGGGGGRTPRRGAADRTGAARRLSAVRTGSWSCGGRAGRAQPPGQRGGQRMLSPQALDALERTAIAVRQKGVPSTRTCPRRRVHRPDHPGAP